MSQVQQQRVRESTRAILVVDDDIKLLEAIQRRYRKTFDITVACGASEALVKLETQGPFAVVVSDYNMPGMNGIQLLCEVREAAPEAVRILLTGNSDMQTAVDAVNQGEVFKFLTKPCSESVLTTTLNIALRLYRDRQVEIEMAEGVRDKFLSTVSHELQTPLAVIRASAEILFASDNLDKATRDEFLSTVVMESDRLSRLVRQILDTAQIEAGSVELDRSQIDLCDVATSAVTCLAEVRDRFQVELDLDLPPGRVSYVGDRKRLQHVFETLIGNALKMTPRGSQVGIRLAETATHCVLRVSDQGPGVNAAAKDRMFDRFVREDEILTSKPQSGGLGLAIAKDIIEMHGGCIRCEDNPVGGAVFIIELHKRAS